MTANAARVYLDWNAIAPLRPEARAAMLAAMDMAGNPSSVHAEGRAVRTVVETARAQVAALMGCEPGDVVFTSGATEAATTVVAAHDGPVHVSATAHDCLAALALAGRAALLGVDGNGRVRRAEIEAVAPGALVCVAWANGETGVIEDEALRHAGADGSVRVLRDMAQMAGKVALAAAASAQEMAGHGPAILSAGKIGGPAGCGALILREGAALAPLLHGGGQERGRRSGTENVVGIAGFGAAAEAARRDLEAGAWARVAEMRDRLEARLEAAAPGLVIFGRGAPRLPNTSCFAVPGWAGETQVMALDLAGFAVSAGAACSSGKVRRASRVLTAMGFDEVAASSAIRVSMGPTTTEAEVMAFAGAWEGLHARRAARAA